MVDSMRAKTNFQSIICAGSSVYGRFYAREDVFPVDNMRGK